MANEVSIQITGHDQGAQQALTSTAAGGEQLAGSVKRVGETAGGVLAANTITNLAGQVTGFMKATVAAGDEIDKTALRLGVTTDALQEMRFWADQNGLSQSDLERAVGRLNQRIGLAEDGTGKYADALAGLGVTIHDTNGQLRPTEDVLRDVVDSLRSIEDPAARSAAAAELFGTRMGRQLQPALDDASLSLDEAARRAHELGIVMDRDAIDASARFSDAMSELQQGSEALLRNGMVPLIEFAGSTVLPTMTRVVEAFGALPEPLQGAVGTVAALSAGLLILTPRILAARVAMQQLGTTASRTAVRGGAVVAAVAAIATAAAVLGDQLGRAETDVQGMSEDLQRLGERGRVTGELTRLFGDDLSELSDRLSAASSAGGRFADLQVRVADTMSMGAVPLRSAREDFRDLDDAMAGAVASGMDADEVLAAVARQAGLNAEQVEALRNLLPEYSREAERQAESTRDAADAQGEAAAAASEHLSSLEALSDELRAQTDPVFALIRAQDQLAAAQESVTEAVEEHGAKSPEHQQALRDEAQAAMAVLAAAGELGDEFTGDLSQAQKQMLSDAGLSSEGIKQLERDMRNARGEANRLDGTRVRIFEEHTRTVTTVNRTIVEHHGVNARQFQRAGGITGGMAAGGASGAGSSAQTGGARGGADVLVGEDGPEIAELPFGTRVIPSGQTAGMLAGGDGGPVVVHNIFHSDGTRASDLLVLLFREVMTSESGFMDEVVERLGNG